MNNSNKPIYPYMYNGVLQDEKGVASNLDTKLIGLTKREYFAAMAMQAMPLKDLAQRFGNQWASQAAADSVSMADALLNELEK